MDKLILKCAVVYHRDHSGETIEQAIKRFEGYFAASIENDRWRSFFPGCAEFVFDLAFEHNGDVKAALPAFQERYPDAWGSSNPDHGVSYSPEEILTLFFRRWDSWRRQS